MIPKVDELKMNLVSDSTLDLSPRSPDGSATLTDGEGVPEMGINQRDTQS